MIKVLFVCLGNICRSPMADAVFADMVRQEGLAAHIRVDSAGTGDWHVGDKAHPGTLNILAAHHIPYDGRSRQLDMADIVASDYILAMDKANLTAIMRLINRGEWTPAQKADRFYNRAGGPEVALFLSYANRLGTVSEIEVPDPYYDDRFDYVYELVKRGCEALLDHIRHGRAALVRAYG